MGIISDLFVRIKGDKTQLDSTLKGAEGSVNKFGSTIKKLGGILAATFAVGTIISFGKEIIKLAAKAEGIKTAFNKLNDPNLLNNLKQATRGTVDSVTLMQKAIQARNFKIPLDQLATYFEFATKRAIETGESVDYLVNSIITGVGRKSVLVMDNLGISAVELQQEVKKVGDFGIASGNIIRRELTSMGDVADTTAVKVQQLAANTVDLKTAWGEFAANSGVYKGALDMLSGSLEIMANKDVTLWQKLLLSMGLYDLYAKSIAKTMSHEFIIPAGTVIKGPKEPEMGMPRQTGPSAINMAVPGVNAGGPFNKDIAALNNQFVSGQIAGAGGNQLRGFGGMSQAAINAAVATKMAAEKQEEANQAEEKALNDLNNIISNANDAIASLGAQLVEGIGEALAGGNVKDIGKQLLSSLAGFLSHFGEMLLATGLGIKAFNEATKTLNAPMAIAAGIAMMLAAGAVRGMLSNASSSVGGGGGGGYANASMSPVKVIVEGKIKGKDIYIAHRRYVEDN